MCYLNVDRRFIWSRTGTLSLTGTGMERLQLEMIKNPNLLKATRRQVEEELEAALEKRGINRVKPWSLGIYLLYKFLNFLLEL